MIVNTGIFIIIILLLAMYTMCARIPTHANTVLSMCVRKVKICVISAKLVML